MRNRAILVIGAIVLGCGTPHVGNPGRFQSKQDALRVVRAFVQTYVEKSSWSQEPARVTDEWFTYEGYKGPVAVYYREVQATSMSSRSLVIKSAYGSAVINTSRHATDEQRSEFLDAVLYLKRSTLTRAKE